MVVWSRLVGALASSPSLCTRPAAETVATRTLGAVTHVHDMHKLRELYKQLLLMVNKTVNGKIRALRVILTTLPASMVGGCEYSTIVFHVM